MRDHLITEVIGGFTLGDAVLVDWTDVTKVCLGCQMLGPGEQPATECPADRMNLVARLARAMRRAEAGRAGQVAAFDETDFATWGTLPDGYAWLPVDRYGEEHHLFAPDGRNLTEPGITAASAEPVPALA